MSDIKAVCLTLVEPLANADKFWYAFTAERPDGGGARVAINFGRNGTDGQCQVKDFPHLQAARAYVTGKYTEKVGKGYDSRKDLEETPRILALGEKLLGLPKAAPPKTANLLEVCETNIAAAADAVGSRKSLTAATVEQYRAAKTAWTELERRYHDLEATMETIAELYEQKVSA